MIVRRWALACALFSSLLAPSAHADLAPPPMVLRAEGQAGTITGPAPDRAEYVLRNQSGEAIDVYLFRVILLDGRTRVPLEITSVEVAGRAAERTVRVPASGSVRVGVGFEVPSAYHGRSSYSLELSFRQSGFGAGESQPALLTRSSGARKWARVADKA